MEFEEPCIANLWSHRFDIDQLSNLVSARLSQRIQKMKESKPKESPVPRLNLDFLNKNNKNKPLAKTEIKAKKDKNESPE